MDDDSTSLIYIIVIIGSIYLYYNKTSGLLRKIRNQFKDNNNPKLAVITKGLKGMAWPMAGAIVIEIFFLGIKITAYICAIGAFLQVMYFIHLENILNGIDSIAQFNNVLNDVGKRNHKLEKSDNRRLLFWLVPIAAMLLILIIFFVGVDNWKLQRIFKSGPAENSMSKTQTEVLKINAGNPTELEDGITTIQNKLEKNPKDAMLWYDIGQLYLYKHDTSQAITMFKKSFIYDLSDTIALSVVGTIILGTGNDYELATQVFKKLILKSPNNGYAYKMLGASYAAMNKHQESLQYDEKAADLNANDPLAYIGISSSYYRLGEYDKAIITIKKAIRINPDLMEAKCILGNYYCALCNYSAAKEIFLNVLENNNSSVNALNIAQLGLADISLSENNSSAALSSLNKVSEMDSTIVGAKYLKLGIVNERQNHIVIARLDYLRSANSSNQMISAFVSLGEMLIKNGNTQEGYLYLQKAKDRDPIIGTTIYKRGLLLYSKGKTKDAIKSFKNASMLDNEDAKRWLKNNSIN